MTRWCFILAVVLSAVCFLPWASRGQESNGVQETNQAHEPIELTEAIRKNLVKASGKGAGLERIEISIELTAEIRIQVKVTSGTLFRSDSPSKQNMVTRETYTRLLDTTNRSATFAVSASCANMHRGTPGESDQFSKIELTNESSDIHKLIDTKEFGSESIRVQQFAIWTITDNPTRTGYTGIGSFGFGSGPSDQEMEKIRQLFAAAKIPTSAVSLLDFGVHGL